MSIHRQFNAHIRRVLNLLPLERRDSFGNHAYVQVKAHPFNVARLRATQQVSCPADLQVLLCDGKPGTQIGVGSDCSQSFEGGLRERLVGAVEEVGIRPLPSSSNATPQLVQL